MQPRNDPYNDPNAIERRHVVDQRSMETMLAVVIRDRVQAPEPSLCGHAYGVQAPAREKAVVDAAVQAAGHVGRIASAHRSFL